MPAVCVRRVARNMAFIAPSLPGGCLAREISQGGTLCSRRAAFSSRGPARRLRMAATSPDDVPSDAPDPADKHIDMDILRRRMSDIGRKRGPGFNPAEAVVDLSSVTDGMSMEEVEEDEFLKQFENLKSLWVIVFTNANDGSDGVYSLTVSEEHIVLAFEDRTEAQRYALCLETQEFPSPQVCELDSAELRKFCGESGFRLGFVPRGALITPPEESAIEDLDSWRGEPSSPLDGSTGLSKEDIEMMKKRLDSLFGQ